MKEEKTQKGITLLIVLLIGTLIILTSIGVGTFATRMTQSLQARSDAVQALYTAEGVFDCVRYWLNQDYRNFSSRINENPSADMVRCNGQTLNFFTAGTTGDPSYNGSGSGTGIGEFTMHTTPLAGTVRVEVERDTHDADLYEGNVRVYSQNVATGNSKGLERFQEYYYYVLYGADVMFLIDRSGSIKDGGDRTNYTVDNEWTRMIDAVNGSIKILMQKVPAPRIGLISFGTDPTDIGVSQNPTMTECVGYGSNCQSSTDWIVPDVQLTDSYADLVDTSGPHDLPKVNLDYAATNLSLALSIAGAELMGKYYPYHGVGPIPMGVSTDAASGAFETIVHSGLSFSNLPDQDSPRDRDDTSFPDVVLIITDGAPNGIMTHVSGNWYESSTYPGASNDFIAPILAPYELGSTKLFRTPTDSKGVLVVDDDPTVPEPSTGTPDSKEYQFCYDLNGPGGTMYPTSGSSPLSSPVRSNTYPHYAMCNTTLIRDKLDSDENMKFISIYVTNDPSYCTTPPPPLTSLPDEAQWLHNDIASVTDAGEVLFAAVCDYSDVRDTVLELFEKLELQKSR